MPEIDYTSGDSPSEVLDEFWRETLSGIRNGRWGSDIRTPIHAGILQLLEEKEIPEEEIEAALQKIVESIYGEEVRMAIHDALLLIHQESTKVEVEERIYYVDQLCKILEIYVVDHGKFGFPVSMPISGSSYFEDDSSGTVATLTLTPTALVRGVAVLFVVYEQGDEPTITDSREGRTWVPLRTFEISGKTRTASAYYVGVNTGETFTVTLTKSTASGNFHAVLRIFYGKNMPAIQDAVAGLSSANYTPESAILAGGYRYYILACVGTPVTFMLSVDPKGGQYVHNLYYGIEECHLYYAGQDPNAPQDNPQKGLQPTFTLSGIIPGDWVALGLSFV